MKFTILCVAFTVFLVCLSVHVLHWRFKKPQNDIVALFFTFVLIPGIVIILLPIISTHFKMSFFPGYSLLERVAIYLLHFAISGIYISSYPAAQANSPSLQILLMFKKSGNNGLTKSEILSGFDHVSILGARMKDLVDTSLLKQKNGGYELTFRGRLFIGVFVFYRTALGLDLKGG